MRQECYNCHIRTVENLIEKFEPDQETAELFLKKTHGLLDNNSELSNPVLATEIHRLARKTINHHNLYEEEKNRSNSLLLEQYPYFEKLVREHPSPRHLAAKLAVAGNIIDYGAHTVREDIRLQIEELITNELCIDERNTLFIEAEKADSVLYIGDNAGEIVFDRLFIETLQHPDLTYAVRGTPVINDVTLEDTKQTGLDSICRILPNGYDAPATILECCSDTFIHAFTHAGLVIAKGQGNFESLMHADHRNLFFMLMAKCQPIADLLGVEVGDMLIMRNRSVKQEDL
jgi:uncharacterized protein with ATP-grasp and redox domains